MCVAAFKVTTYDYHTYLLTIHAVVNKQATIITDQYICFIFVVVIQAISCHYASTTHCDYIDIEGTTHEIIAKEVTGIAKKKLGDEVDFEYQVMSKITLIYLSY